MTEHGLNEIIYNALDALYISPVTGEVNEGYIQHINARAGIEKYAEKYIKSVYNIDITVSRSVIEDWLVGRGKSLEKILNNDKKRVQELSN